MLIDVRTSVAQSDRNARLHPLAMLDLFEQLKSPGTGQMTLTSVNRRFIVLTPTNNHFCEENAHQTRSIFCFYQKDGVSERKAFPAVVVGDA